VKSHHIESEHQKRLSTARRAVIKLGTGIVTGSGGQFNTAQLEPLARTIAHLKNDGRQVVMVSSGAVGLGRGALGLHRDRLHDLVMRQACAAVGQSLLMHEYEKLFAPHDIRLAQVLLTEGDFMDRNRYANLRQTMEALLKLGVMPVINENDTVSTAELDYLNVRAGERIFSDNDRLAALVMSRMEADVLVLLTDVDGLMNFEFSDASRSADGTAGTVIPVVDEISAEIKALATGPSQGGRGGMLTKLEAAEIAMQSGGIAVIANGKNPDTLARIFAGDPVGTVFLSKTRMAGKRRWIAYAAGVRGRVVVNSGARQALTGGKASLLATGVVRVEGEFEAMEVVSIVGDDGREFARGISDFARGDAEGMIGGLTKDPTKDQTNSPRESAQHQPGRQPGRASVLVKRDNIVLLDRK
jgi:glutamate 5-kinase